MPASFFVTFLLIVFSTFGYGFLLDPVFWNSSVTAPHIGKPIPGENTSVPVHISRNLLQEQTPLHKSIHNARKLTECWARNERHLYHQASDVRPSVAWRKRLNVYAVMHKRCTSPILNWLEFYKNPESGDGVDPEADISGCKYLMWVAPSYAGLGNRLASLASAFFYAVLTNRALMISEDSTIGRFLCNPWKESPWSIDQNSFIWMRRNANRWFPRVKQYGRLVLNRTKEYRKTVFINLKFNCEEDDWSFFCELEQKLLTEAPFAFFHTDEYIVPALYLLPHFRDTMDRLFPDGVIFPHVARYLFLPNNYLWDRITKIFHTYIANHDQIVGIQVRSFHAWDRGTDSRVLRCAKDVSKYLPGFFSKKEWAKKLRQGSDDPLVERMVSQLVSMPNPRTMAVLVTSLQRHHYEYLKEAYSEGQTLDGSVVAFHMESSEKSEEKDNIRQLERAFVEMWLLSFSHKLITSEFSSFGYIAAGLAGLNPYEMNIAHRKQGTSYKTNGRGVCSLGSMEPCYIVPPKYLTCYGRKVPPGEIHRLVTKCPNVGLGLSIKQDFEVRK